MQSRGAEDGIEDQDVVGIISISAGWDSANRRRLFLGLTGISYALAREEWMERQL